MNAGQKTLIVLYALIGILTFGHASASRQAADIVEFRTCRTNPKALCFEPISAEAGIVGIIAAPLWPFYWSWIAFEESK